MRGKKPKLVFTEGTMHSLTSPKAYGLSLYIEPIEGPLIRLEDFTIESIAGGNLISRFSHNSGNTRKPVSTHKYYEDAQVIARRDMTSLAVDYSRNLQLEIEYIIGESIFPASQKSHPNSLV